MKCNVNTYAICSLTQLKEGDITLDPWSSSVTGGDLYAVADARRQTGDDDRKSGAIHRTIDMVSTLIAQAPNLQRNQTIDNIQPWLQLFTRNKGNINKQAIHVLFKHHLISSATRGLYIASVAFPSYTSTTGTI